MLCLCICRLKGKTVTFQHLLEVLPPQIVTESLFLGFAIISMFLQFKKYVQLLSGYLQSLFGVYSVRIENVGVRRPPSDDVQIQGIANPRAFKKVLSIVEQ